MTKIKTASHELGEAMNTLTAEMKKSPFRVTMEQPALEKIFAKLSAVHNKVMAMEARHVSRCDECGAVIASHNLVMLPSGRVKIK